VQLLIPKSLALEENPFVIPAWQELSVSVATAVLSNASSIVVSLLIAVSCARTSTPTPLTKVRWVRVESTTGRGEEAWSL
jgi:hypothetical protein